MNKKIILALGLPMVIRSRAGQTATIELSHNDFVVCRYHPDNLVYLNDARLDNWYPKSLYVRILYNLRTFIVSIRNQ